MAIFLVMDKDNKMPTVQEWREWMNITGIPKAQKFLNENPYTQAQFDICHENLNRLQDYRYTKAMFRKYVETGSEIISPKVQEFITIIEDYESNPVSQADIDFAKKLLFDESKTVSSIESRWKYHKNLIEVEALKSDEMKETELKGKDQRGCYKRGHIVEIFEDDTPCVIPSAPPFVIIKALGITKAQADKYTQSETEVIDVPIDEQYPDGKQTITTRRRAFQVLIDSLPTTFLNKLKKDRYVEVTFDQIKNYIKNLKTGLTE